MNDELHINGAVSALVMLAAIAGTWSVYADYKDNQVAIQYEDTQSSLEQTASALAAFRIAHASAMVEATSTATTTEKTAKVTPEVVE